MAEENLYLNTWYAKRIIGDSAASNPSDALLQSGLNIAADMWIFNQTNRSSSTSVLYGIQYKYDDDILYFYGGQSKNNTAIPSAQINLKSGTIWAGSEPTKNTNNTNDVTIGARSGAGEIYFYSENYLFQ